MELSMILALLSGLLCHASSVPSLKHLDTRSTCVTPSFVPCYAPGTNMATAPPPAVFNGGFGGGAAAGGGGSGFFDSLQAVALSPIQKTKRDLASILSARQNSLCCNPANQCRIVRADNTPFCYNSTSTRYVFADESYGFVNNGSFYGSDGSFVNFKTGQFTRADGTTGTFTPDGGDSASSASSSAVASGGAGSAATATAESGSTPTSSSATTTITSGGSAASSSTSSHKSSAVSVAMLRPLTKEGAWGVGTLLLVFTILASG